MIGASQLAMNLQIKIAVSIVIFRTELDAGTVLQEAAKEQTTKLHEMIQTVPKGERKGTMPPFLLFADSLIIEGTKIARSYGTETIVYQAFTEYSAYSDAMASGDRVQALLEDWRLARFKTTYSKERCLIEFGVSPICSKYAKPVFKTI